MLETKHHEAFSWLHIDKWDEGHLIHNTWGGQLTRICKLCDERIEIPKAKAHAKAHKTAEVKRRKRNKELALIKAREERKRKAAEAKIAKANEEKGVRE